MAKEIRILIDDGLAENLTALLAVTALTGELDVFSRIVGLILCAIVEQKGTLILEPDMERHLAGGNHKAGG